MKPVTVKFPRFAFSLSAFLFLTLCPFAFTQIIGTASHTVTVNVLPVTIIQVNVGTINLNITGAEAIAGQDQMSVTDQTSTLLWGTNSSLRKITINTDLVAPLFVVKVEALTPSAGTAAAEVILSTTAQDLILNIGRSTGSSNIRYTGIALASQGIGTDSHVITLTIQAQ